jgi:hypothetical protein
MLRLTVFAKTMHCYFWAGVYSREGLPGRIRTSAKVHELQELRTCGFYGITSNLGGVKEWPQHPFYRLR